MDPFAKQFGVYEYDKKTKKHQYALQAYWLSLYSSVIWIGFGVGMAFHCSRASAILTAS